MINRFKKLGTPIKIVLLLLMLIIVFFVVKNIFFKSETKSKYVTEQANLIDIEQSVMATGVVGAYKQVSVGAQVSGEIKTLNVVLGQKVIKGDLLAIIDAQKQQNALDSARADLHSIQATLNAKQSTLQKAKLDFNRQSMMINYGATSKQEYDNAKVALQLAKSDIEQTKALIEKSKISVETSEVSLDYTKVVAPMDGIVVSIAVEAGQTVNTNQTTPTLLVIADLSKMTIKAEIPEGDILKLKAGMDATFTVMGDSKTIYKAKLRSIDPGPTTLSDNAKAESTQSGTPIYYYGILDVPNSDGKLRISMTAQITIIVNSIKNTLTIPSLALGDEVKGGYKIKILKKDSNGEHSEDRVVKIGLNDGINSEVLSGLKKGDLVIVSEQKDEETTGGQNKKMSASEAMSKRRMSSSMSGM